MMRNSLRLAAMAGSLAFGLGMSNTAFAWSMQADDFLIVNNISVGAGSVSYNTVHYDGFNDGNLATNPDSGVPYVAIRGNPTEGGGRLNADASQGTYGTSFTGQPRLLSRVRANTGGGSAAPLSGSTNFLVGAAFDLTTPDPRGRYGVRLTDQNTTGVFDTVDLSVRRNAAGDLQVAYSYFDYANSLVQTINAVGLTPTTDHIGLFLSNYGTGNSVSAMFVAYNQADLASLASASDAYTYLLLHGQTLGSHAIFGTRSWTQAELAAVQAVPEPQTWLLMAAGIGLIGMRLRRRA